MASIVDYLSEKNYDSSFGSRRLLWEQFHPGKSYSGTAEQNLDLLAALELDDATPKLALTAATYNVGDSVKAIVQSEGQVLIETELRLQSINVDAGGEADLGAAAAGFYTIRVRNGIFGRALFLILSPIGLDGQLLEARFIPQPLKWQTAPTEISFQTPQDPTLPWMKYVNYLEAHPEILQDALDEVFTAEWVGENLVSLSTTTVVCAVGIWNVCIASGASNFIGAASDILKAAADKVPDDILSRGENGEKNEVKGEWHWNFSNVLSGNGF